MTSRHFAWPGLLVLATLAWTFPAAAEDGEPTTAAPEKGSDVEAVGEAAVRGDDETTRDLIDYATLDHKIHLDAFRAGNHDPSGVNEYAFQVLFHGLVNTHDERKKAAEERRKVTIDGGEWHPLTLESLKQWKADPKDRDARAFKVSGDMIRQLTASTMTQFKVNESEVAVVTEIILREKGKKFYFFGEDTEVARTRYYPLPATQFDSPPRTNLSLALDDDTGTHVILSVEYAKPAASALNEER